MPPSAGNELRGVSEANGEFDNRGRAQELAPSAPQDSPKGAERRRILREVTKQQIHRPPLTKLFLFKPLPKCGTITYKVTSKNK